jgi:hypothetical protein
MFWFWRLAAAHFLADFPFQTDLVYRYKVTKRWGVGLHVAIQGALAFAVSWPYLGSAWTWAALAFLLTTHYVMDAGKLRMISKKLPDNLLFFLLDQAMHLGWIALVCFVHPDVGRAHFGVAAIDPVWLDDRWFQFVIAFIIAMWGGEVFLFYARKAILSRTQQTVLFPRRWQRMFRMVERGAITAGVAFGGYFLVLLGLALAARVHWIVIMRRKMEKHGLLLGIALSVGVGLILRFFVVGT